MTGLPCNLITGSVLGSLSRQPEFHLNSTFKEPEYNS